jgi:DNA modification methylase
MVEVFRLVREVLADDGTLWLNLGDSYAGSNSGNSMRPEGGTQRPGKPGFQSLDDRYPKRNGVVPTGLKPKDLIGMPWRVAFALQADGWYLRSDIIWAKPNPMPESVTDRPTKSHEYLFLMTKGPRYYYDADGVREPHRTPEEHRASKHGRQAMRYYAQGGRNLRTVWTIPTEAFSDAHFATFPRKLVEPCIMAGSRPGDIVLDPFLGSGTVAQVAQNLGRAWIGIDLNPSYEPMQEQRTAQTALSLA